MKKKVNVALLAKGTKNPGQMVEVTPEMLSSPESILTEMKSLLDLMEGTDHEDSCFYQPLKEAHKLIITLERKNKELNKILDELCTPF